MTTEVEPQVNGTTPETVPAETPDRGAQDDAYFQRFIDESAEEDDLPLVGVDAVDPSTETPSAETPPPATTLEPPPIEPAPVVPETPAPIVPNEVDALRQQNQAYEQRLQQQALEAQRLQLEQEAQQMAAQLQDQGVMPERAAQIANDQRQLREQSMQAQGQLQAQHAYMEGKMNAALHYAQAHNVDPQTLMQFDTPQAMETHAKQQARITTLEQQVSQQTKAQVPAQAFDTGQVGVTGGTSETRLVDSALNKAPGERTEAESAALRRMAGG